MHNQYFVLSCSCFELLLLTLNSLELSKQQLQLCQAGLVITCAVPGSAFGKIALMHQALANSTAVQVGCKQDRSVETAAQGLKQSKAETPSTTAIPDIVARIY